MKRTIGMCFVASVFLICGCQSIKTVWHDATTRSKQDATDKTTEPVVADKAQPQADAMVQPQTSEAGQPHVADKTGGAQIADNANAPKAAILPTTVVQSINAALPAKCPLEAQWALPIPGITIKKIWVMPKELEYNMVLVLSTERDLIAIESTSGRTLWWKKLDGDITGEPAISKFSIYLIIKNHLVNMDKTGGIVLWRTLLDFPAGGPMTVSEEKQGQPVFCISSVARVIYGVDMVKVTWPPKHGAGSITQKDFKMDSFHPRILWRCPTDSLIMGDMAFVEGFVYATDLDGVIYAVNSNLVNLGRAMVTWKEYSQAGNFAGVLTSGTFVIIGSRDRNIYCYARKAGGLVWRYESGFRIEEKPSFLVDRWTNTTYVGFRCTDGPYVTIADMDGELKWKHEAGGRAVGLDEEKEKPLNERTSILIHETDGAISSVAFKDGTVHWSIASGLLSMVGDNHESQGIVGVTQKEGALVYIGRSE